MPRDTRPEVLVVGAGPVGLFAAATLTRHGVPVEIVDTGVWATTHSYALALHPQSMGLFEEAGLLDRVLESAYPVRRVGFYDASARRASVNLGGGSGDKRSLAVLRQDVVEHLLEEALSEHGTRVSWRHDAAELAPAQGHVTATINTLEKESRGYVVAHSEWVVAKSRKLDVPFVIGADGYNSRVRRALNLDYPEVGPAHYYAVFEFKSDADLGDEVRVVFGDRTTDVLWPLPGGFCRWSFQLPDYSDPQAEELKDYLLKSGFGYYPTERFKDRLLASPPTHPGALDEADLGKMIAERAPWFKGSLERVTWRTVIRFERRLASAFGGGRMWLAGDAAHLTGPVGVQSMNLGLFETDDLASIIAGILRGGRTTEELGLYNERWLATWRQLLGLENPLQPGPGTDPWVAKYADRFLSCLPAHGEQLDALAAQLGLAVGERVERAH